MGLLRKAKRLQRKKELKEAKMHKREIYKIFQELEYLASIMKIEGVELTEDNIVDEVAKRSELKLGAFEKAILLNYFRSYEDTNTEADEELPSR